MKKSIAAILAAGAFAGATHAKVSFSLSIEAITSDGGSALSNSGLLVLVVDSDNDGIALPSDGSFGEEVVAMWDLSATGPGTSDITLLTEGGVGYGVNWDAGEPLALFWFPNLTESDVPSATEAYGVFTDSQGITSGDPWEMPEDGTILHSLKLFTASATNLVAFGDVPDGAGSAAFAVNAPPSSSSSPTSLQIVNSNGDVVVSWSSPEAPSGGYLVRRKPTTGPDSDTWETVGFVPQNETSYTDSDVKPGLEYDYQILAQGGITIAQSDTSPTIETERSVLKSVAARSRVVGSDPSTAIFGGVIVGGNDPTKNIVMQGLGRSFFNQDFWVNDLTLELRNGSTVIGASDDWLDQANAVDIDTAMSEDNAFPLLADGSSLDPSILIDAEINQGYSFSLESKDGSDGDAFLGIISADSPTLGENDNRIVSLAVRGYLDDPNPDSLYVAGIEIRGNVPKEVLVMAFGPYLSGVIDGSLDGQTIADPSLTLRIGGEDTIIATNEDWIEQTAGSHSSVSVEQDSARVLQVMTSLGWPAFENDAPEAALLVTLDPGSYTFTVNGAGGQGIGFIQINEVEGY